VRDLFYNGIPTVAVLAHDHPIDYLNLEATFAIERGAFILKIYHLFPIVTTVLVAGFHITVG